MTVNDGMCRYSDMQRRYYQNQARSYQLSMDRCVGNYKVHQAYPYKEYLLERYSGAYEKCLDFGCGMGRLMAQMLPPFDMVVGVDISENNIRHAKKYLSEEDIDDNKYDLFEVSGVGCDIDVDYKFDFAYSTICLQHICVHDTRNNIFKDIYDLLKGGGQACFQMGTGYLPKIGGGDGSVAFQGDATWKDNHYDVAGTNSERDVFIPSAQDFPMIEEDFNEIGYEDVVFDIKESPHPENEHYHSSWLFIHCSKY